LGYNRRLEASSQTDHDEVREVDDCDGCCDEKIASTAKLLFV